MSKIVSRMKELINLYEAVTAICEAAYEINEEHGDAGHCISLLSMLAMETDNNEVDDKFCENNADYVIKWLTNIARNSTRIRPYISERTGAIIENLQVLKREYDRLKEAEFEDEVLKDFPTVLDGFFEDLAKAVVHYPDCRKFGRSYADGWMDLYWHYFNSLANTIIQRIVYETGNFDHLLLREIVEVLKNAAS